MDNEKNKMKMKMKKNKMKMKRAGLPSINVFPYKCSYYLNCCQILYSYATDPKSGSSTYFFLGGG